MGLRTINRQRKKTILRAREVRRKLYGLGPKKMDTATRISRQNRYQMEFDRHYNEMLSLDQKQAIQNKKGKKKVKK